MFGSDNGLAPNMWQAFIWSIDGLVCWRIYASLRLNELKYFEHMLSGSDRAHKPLFQIIHCTSHYWLKLKFPDTYQLTYNTGLAPVLAECYTAKITLHKGDTFSIVFPIEYMIKSFELPICYYGIILITIYKYGMYFNGDLIKVPPSLP